METDSAVEIRTQLGFPQLLENSLEDSAFSQFPQARRRAKYQPISVAAIHLKTRGLLSEEWGAPQDSRYTAAKDTLSRALLDRNARWFAELSVDSTKEGDELTTWLFKDRPETLLVLPIRAC